MLQNRRNRAQPKRKRHTGAESEKIMSYDSRLTLVITVCTDKCAHITELCSELAGGSQLVKIINQREIDQREHLADCNLASSVVAE